jgi:outer membrane protein assembly factor BamA
LTRRLGDNIPATLAYRLEQTAVEAGDLYFCVNYGICDLPTVNVLQQRHSLSPASLGFFADRADSPIGPTQGWRARMDMEHASGFTASDFHYHRISGEATRYEPFGVHRRRVLAGRIRAGWVRPLSGTAEAIGIELGDQALLHPRKRFYAGGSRSVRGYGENQLGPRILTIDPMALRGLRVANGDSTFVFCGRDVPIAACDPNQVAEVNGDTDAVPVDAFTPRPLGGTNVVEASVEYRFPLWGLLQGAVFVDAGLVGERLDEVFAGGAGSITPGFGARFPTPVGPIRVDLGIRPTITERLPVVTEEVDADGNRRLVRLQELRDYDPLADAGGFIRQVLTRLTLHLSIGEAF